MQIELVITDRYGRTVAWVYGDRKNLCEELVKNGLAWHYKKYSSDQNLADLEIRARKAKAGLWSDPLPYRPGNLDELANRWTRFIDAQVDRKARRTWPITN